VLAATLLLVGGRSRLEHAAASLPSVRPALEPRPRARPTAAQQADRAAVLALGRLNRAIDAELAVERRDLAAVRTLSKRAARERARLISATGADVLGRIRLDAAAMRAAADPVLEQARELVRAWLRIEERAYRTTAALLARARTTPAAAKSALTPLLGQLAPVRADLRTVATTLRARYPTELSDWSYLAAG